MAEKSQVGQKKCRLDATVSQRKRAAVSLGDVDEDSAEKLVSIILSVTS